jgi:hypothetical protein
MQRAVRLTHMGAFAHRARMRMRAAVLLGCTLMACGDGSTEVPDDGGVAADGGTDDAGRSDAASSDGGAADATVQAHVLDDFGQQVNDAVCDFQTSCGVFATKADCLVSMPFSTLPLEGQLAAGTLVFHPEHVATCVGQLAAIADCALTTKLQTIDMGSAPICVEAFQGTVVVGGACVDAIECTTHVCTKPPSCTDACCMGSCAPAPITDKAAIGESCADRRCVPGAYCQHSTSMCKARVAEGEVCDDAFSCVISAICDPDTASVKTCKHIAAHAESCDRTSIVACDRSDDFCALQGSTCTRFPGIGEACSAAIHCLPLARCVSNVCVSLPRTGEACTVGGARCQGALECVNGVCTSLPSGLCPN